MLEALLATYKPDTGAIPSSGPYALFMGGLHSTTIYAETERHVYSNAAIVPGQNLSVGHYAICAAGNSTQGVMTGGHSPGLSNSKVTEKYTYASHTVTLGTSITENRTYSSAVGRSDKAYYAGGVGPLSSVDIYTHADDTWVAGNALSSGRVEASASGNTLYGMVFGGYNTTANSPITTTDRYTFATNAKVAGGNLGTLRRGAAACGTTTAGIVSLGYNGTTYVVNSEKYTYSANTYVAGGSLDNISRYRVGAASNGTIGVWGGGGSGNNGQWATSRYTFASDTAAASSLMVNRRQALAGVSSSPVAG